MTIGDEKRKTFSTRLPPHVYRDMEAMFDPFRRHFKNHVSQSDMVGALIMRAKRDPVGLMEDLAAFLDSQDAWEEGIVHRPES